MSFFSSQEGSLDTDLQKPGDDRARGGVSCQSKGAGDCPPPPRGHSPASTSGLDFQLWAMREHVSIVLGPPVCGACYGGPRNLLQSGLCCCLVPKSCLTLCNPMDCSPPGSSVHGILQARTLEWVAISFSKGSSQHRDQTQISCLLHWQVGSLPLRQEAQRRLCREDSSRSWRSLKLK